MKVIAWDVDDVLNDLMYFWFCQKWLLEHSGCSIKYEDLVENPPHKILKIRKEEYLNSLDEFRLSGLYSKMQPISEIRNWFIKYGKFFRHIVVTAVPLKSCHISAEWVMKHFGEWIRTFHFVPSKRSGENIVLYDKTKQGFLKWFNKVDVFIDDNEDNINECESIGIKCVLFPRPWNKSKLSIEEVLLQLNRMLGM